MPHIEGAKAGMECTCASWSECLKAFYLRNTSLCAFLNAAYWLHIEQLHLKKKKENLSFGVDPNPLEKFQNLFNYNHYYFWDGELPPNSKFSSLFEIQL